MSSAPEVLPIVLNEKLTYFIWKLLRLRWVLFISNLRRSKTRYKVGYILLILLALGVMAGAFALSWWILNFLNSTRLSQILGDPSSFLEAVPTMVLFATFAGILITSFGVLLQALYLANDMDFLLSAPVPIRAVFVAKLLQAVLPNFGLILLFGLPVLFGLGASQHYNLFFYPLVIIMLFLLALSAAGIASLLVMGIVRIFPARRVAEVLAFVGAILSFICGQSGQIFRFQTSNAQTINALNSLARINVPWFPLAWAGRSMVAVGKGIWIIGSVELLLITGLAGFIFWFSLLTAERLYYSGWAIAQMNPRKKKTQLRTHATPALNFPHIRWFERLLSAPVRTIVLKDFLVLRRDLRNLSQLVTPLIFGVLYTFILLRDTQNTSQGRSAEPFSALIKYGNTGIALFVGWMLLMRLALIAFSQEGKNYWLIKTAPVSPQRLLAAKFLVAFLPSTGLGWIFLLATSLLHHADLLTTAYGFIVITFTFAGLSGVLLAFGAYGANLEWNDPRQMIRSNAGCFGSLIGMVYIVLSGGLFYAPPIIGPIIQLPIVAGNIAGLILGGIFSLVCAYIPLQLVFQRVEHLGEK